MEHMAIRAWFEQATTWLTAKSSTAELTDQKWSSFITYSGYFRSLPMNNKPSDIGLPTPVVTVERLELSTHSLWHQISESDWVNSKPASDKGYCSSDWATPSYCPLRSCVGQEDGQTPQIFCAWLLYTTTHPGLLSVIARFRLHLLSCSSIFLLLLVP